MFQTACLTCGAPVTFRSATSAMAVCEYCQTAMLRHDTSVEMAGKMSAILEDYSPIQIGSSGVYAGKAFQTIGRIQLRYADGFWNEWYIWFDDGQTGWLSDASNQFVVTLADGIADQAPAFEDLIPGSIYATEQRLFIASDVRTATCTAGEGELPFRVGEGWEAKVADFRTGNFFLTLDYSDQTPPARYVGKSASLTDLKMQNLRSDEQITERAGKLKGKNTSLSCPACGSGISFIPGVAPHLMCPSCQAQIDATADQAVILERHQKEQQVSSTFKLGDIATILGLNYTLIGLMKCQEVDADEYSTWWEYLLYHPSKGFLWLVETEDGWEQINVLDTWPAKLGGKSIPYNGIEYQHLYDYEAKVIYAAGAFNWRVNIGDRTNISDYGRTGSKLTLEKTRHELNWSLAKKVPASTIGSWFGQTLEEKKPLTNSADLDDLISVASTFSFIFGAANLFLMDEFDAGFMPIIFGLALLWIPILILKLKAR